MHAVLNIPYNCHKDCGGVFKLCLSSHDIETSGLGSLQSTSGAEGCQECGCVVTKNCVQSSGLMFFSESFNFQKRSKKCVLIFGIDFLMPFFFYRSRSHIFGDCLTHPVTATTSVSRPVVSRQRCHSSKASFRCTARRWT